MNKQRLDEIRARCEAATPGPWEAGRPDVATVVGGYESKWIYAGEGNNSKYLAISSGYEISDWEEVMANARFIAHARQDIPDLLAEVARLTAELDAAKRDLRHADNCDICAHAAAPGSCDLECDVCKLGCTCRDCRDENLWQWRGPQKGKPDDTREADHASD